MSLLKTPWFSLVELMVATTTTQWVNFPDQPDLTTLIDEQINILAVELITDQVQTVAPSGNVVAPVSELVKGALQLIDADKKRIYQMPLLLLNRMYSDPNTFIPHQMDLQLFLNLSRIAWTKSGVQFMTPPVFAGQDPYSILFGVHYEKIATDKVKTV